MTTLTLAQVAALRMQALGLAGADAGMCHAAEQVVERHLAMQAQDWGASRYAIGSRAPQLRDADVLAAYDAGAIVRSWPMRGTVHVTLAQDLPWMLELMSKPALSGIGRRWETLGIDETFLERAREVAIARLAGGARASRDELAAGMVEAGLDVTGQRRYHVVWYLAQTGTLVQGPVDPATGEQLLVLLDEWIPRPIVLSREEALAELGRRYLRARGPASVADLQHWTKLGVRACRAAFEANRDALVERTCEQTTLYMLAEHAERYDPNLPATELGTHALAAFDEHLLGYRNRSAALPSDHAKIVMTSNGIFKYTLVHEGRVAGIWTRKKRARAVDVTVAALPGAAAPPADALERAFARYAHFIGASVNVLD